ncbi:MAG TPA: helicase C-terminal domain-containing protein, partial [Sphingomicrobium sp.]
PPPIQKLAAKFLNDPKRVEATRPATANVNIEQRLVEVRADKKKDKLRELLRATEFKNAIVFCNRKTTVRELFSSLKRSGFAVGQIHGDMEQSDRIAEFDRFKQDEINILVASDVAARGLDVKGVSHVINFDVPWQPDDYIHRIGRTGRAGMKGIAITLAAPADGEQVAAIEKLTGTKIARVGAVEDAAVPAEGEMEREPPEARNREPRETRDREPRRGRRDRKPRGQRSETRETAAPTPAAKEERKPRPARRAESEEKTEEADEGWNGPMPSFLSIRAD